MFEYNGFVSRVVDGDTVICEVDLGFNVITKQRFRLKDVLVPEKRDDDEAWDEMKQFVEVKFGKQYVEIKSFKLDKYGRYVAILTDRSGRSVNDQITEHLQEYLDARANK